VASRTGLVAGSPDHSRHDGLSPPSVEHFAVRASSASAQFDPKAFEVHSVSHWFSADRNQDVVRGDRTTIGQCDGHRAVGVPCDLRGPRAQKDGDARIGEHLLDRGGDIRIFSGEELTAALDNRDLNADGVEQVGEFAADISAAEHDDALG
jgi:hypothetical protein